MQHVLACNYAILIAVVTLVGMQTAEHDDDTPSIALDSVLWRVIIVSSQYKQIPGAQHELLGVLPSVQLSICLALTEPIAIDRHCWIAWTYMEKRTSVS